MEWGETGNNLTSTQNLTWMIGGRRNDGSDDRDRIDAIANARVASIKRLSRPAFWRASSERVFVAPVAEQHSYGPVSVNQSTEKSELPFPDSVVREQPQPWQGTHSSRIR